MSDMEMANMEENEIFDPTLMKKKKKKTKKPILKDETGELIPTGESNVSLTMMEPGEGEDEEFDFSKKKKKTKKKKDTEDLEAQELSALAEKALGLGTGETLAVSASALNEEEVENDDFIFVNEGETVEDPWVNSDRDYTYSELLSRVFRILHEHNPALAGGRKRYTMVPPLVAREGSKKTAFANIADICNRMKRNMEHVIQFMYAELGTSGSVDGSQRLIIKGRFQPKQIENVLRRYIVEYVTCKTCKSPETTLRKENRLYFMQCDSCGSTRSVSAIKTGFQAQTSSRRAAKAKAA